MRGVLLTIGAIKLVSTLLLIGYCVYRYRRSIVADRDCLNIHSPDFQRRIIDEERKYRDRLGEEHA